MSDHVPPLTVLFDGWHSYQARLCEALAPLSHEQLALRPAPTLRTVHQIATHIIGARARWFGLLFGEGGDEFKELGQWDQGDARRRDGAELVEGLERSWATMQSLIEGWGEKEWAQSWPGEDDTEPTTITRSWVLWHLIEHDIHHGGEIGIILGTHGIDSVNL